MLLYLQQQKQSEQQLWYVREMLFGMQFGMPLNGYDVEFLPFIYITYKKNFF
jgi:hypothetical protein